MGTKGRRGFQVKAQSVQWHKDAKGHVMREEHQLVQYMQCKASGKNEAGEVHRGQVINSTAAVRLGVGFYPESNGSVETEECHDQSCISEQQF